MREGWLKPRAAAEGANLLAPYAHEHAARVTEPGEFLRIRDVTDAMRKKGWKIPAGVRCLGGPKKGGKWGVQAWRFDSGRWTAAEAKKWLKDNDHAYKSFEPATGVAKSEAMIAIRAEEFSLIAAEAAPDGTKRLPTFSMLAYSGGLLYLENFVFPLVADLAGLKVQRDQTAVLRQHDPTKFVGHADAVANDGK